MNDTLMARAEEQAALCRVFSNPCRLMILWALADRELPVGEIAARVGSSMQNVSQHLSLLRRHDLISSRREGQHIFYSLNQSSWLTACPAMKVASVNELNIPIGGI